jgi:hypothetical protein
VVRPEPLGVVSLEYAAMETKSAHGTMQQAGPYDRQIRAPSGDLFFTSDARVELG